MHQVHAQTSLWPLTRAWHPGSLAVLSNVSPLQAAKAAAELQADAAAQLASELDRDLTLLEGRPSAAEAGPATEAQPAEQDDVEITEQELLVSRTGLCGSQPLC